MTEDTVVSLVCASYEAYARKDRAVIEALICEDFHFTSPLDNRIDRKTYFARCWPNSENIESFKFINLVRDGDHVIVTYEGRAKDGHIFRNTEIASVRGKQIYDIEVYFGWSIPHKAAPGKFSAGASGAQHP